MADFALPSLNSTYSDLVDMLKARDVSAMKMFDGTTDSNLPSGTKRWNSTNSYFEKFDGSAWSPLAAKYMINVDLVDGCTVNDGGSTTSDLWTASKITTQLSTKLAASTYTAADVLTKIKTVDGAGSGLDADLLDGMNTTTGNVGSTIVSRDASGNFSAGTITAALSGNASSATTSASCSGNAATAYGLNIHTGRNNEANKVVRTDGNGYLQTGYINCSAGDENNNTNADRVWGTNGSDQYMRTYRTSALRVAYANSALKLDPLSGDSNYKLCYTADSQRTNAGEWGRAVMRYEPNGQTYGVRVDRADYANDCGNADTVDGYHASSLMGAWNGGASFGTSGYQKFSNGLIIQWGQATVTANGEAVTATFPIAFPNSCMQVVRAEKFVSTYNYTGAIQSWNNYGVTANNWVAGTWHYIAIGY